MGWIVLFFGIFTILGYQEVTPQRTNLVVEGSLEFYLKTYGEIIKTIRGNFVFSGLSLETALALLADGAAGKTQQEILAALSLPGNQKLRDQAFKQLIASLKINDDKLKVLMANGIFPDNELCLSEKFKKVALNYYSAGVQSVDYKDPVAAAAAINDWVATQTLGKITDLISDLTDDTVLLLVSTLFFEGNWKYPFETFNTKKSKFYLTPSTSKDIDMMHTEATVKFLHSDVLKAKFLELPFQVINGKQFSMVFILPDRKFGLAAVEVNLKEYLKQTGLELVRVAITIPKGTTTTEIDLKPILMNLNVREVFSNQADLSKLTKSKQTLKVSAVTQKTVIEVSETGVRAVAATGVVINPTSLPPPPEASFNANRPFIYLIKDDITGAILFIGRFSGQ